MALDSSSSKGKEEDEGLEIRERNHSVKLGCRPRVRTQKRNPRLLNWVTHGQGNVQAGQQGPSVIWAMPKVTYGPHAETESTT